MTLHFLNDIINDDVAQSVTSPLWAEHMKDNCQQLHIALNQLSKYKIPYQLPFILTALLHIDLINVAYLPACICIRYT